MMMKRSGCAGCVCPYPACDLPKEQPERKRLLLVNLEIAMFIFATGFEPVRRARLGVRRWRVVDHELVWRAGDGRLFVTCEPYLPRGTDATQALAEVRRAGWTGAEAAGHGGWWNPPYTRLFVLAPPAGLDAADIAKRIDEAWHERY